jgi:hypothetical protein
MDLRLSGPPIDLYAIARRQNINRIKLCPMIHRGALLATSTGFQVLLRHPELREFDLNTPEHPYLLNAQQRFTLAHEIAHTHFYQDPKGKLVPTSEAKEYAYSGEIRLEKICDRLASRILVPARILESDIKNLLNNESQRIDSGLLRALVRRYRTSYEVMIRRLHETYPKNTFRRCILLVRKRHGDCQVSAWYMGRSFSDLSPIPEQFSPVRNWFQELPLSILEREPNAGWKIVRSGRELAVQKFPIGKRGEFILQIDDPMNTAPSSNFPWHGSRVRHRGLSLPSTPSNSHLQLDLEWP